MSGLRAGNLLDQGVMTAVTDAHLLLDAKFGNDARFGRAFLTENLTAVTAMVLHRKIKDRI